MSYETMKHLITVIGIMGAGIAIWFWMEWTRKKYRRLVKGNMLVEWLLQNGGTDTRLCPIEMSMEDGAIVKDERRKKDDKVPRYFVRAGCARRSWYPEGGFMAMLGAPIEKIIYEEGQAEPLIFRVNRNENDVDASADMVGHVIDQKATEVGAEVTKEIDELSERLNERIRPRILYVLMAALFVGICVNGYLSYTNLTSNSDMIVSIEGLIQAVKAGMGLP